MTQLTSKFIANDAANSAKMRLDNNAGLRARNNANSADITLFKLTTGDVFEAQVQPFAASGLAIPTADKAYATIEYIKNYVQGKQDAKDAVNVLADVNVPLTGSTTLVVDGITVLNLMRVALTNQTTGSQNGIYDAAIAGANWTLTRSTDFDQLTDAGGTEVTPGAYFVVIQGTVYANYEVIVNNTAAITVGTTTITFAKIPTPAALTGGDMIVKTANDFAVDLAANGGLESTNPGNAAGQLRVKTNTGATEKDRTAQLDGSGNVTAKKSKKATFTLAAQDITNQYVDLADVAADSSVLFTVAGAPQQHETTDYTVNYTGGASSKTRITFAGGLATAGASALAAGDIVNVAYTAF